MFAIRWQRNITRALAVGLIALTLLGTGYLVGANKSPSWNDGTATVFDNFATVESGGSSYDITPKVAWIDSAGTHQRSSWPGCLDVLPGTETTVRFASVDVRIEGASWRQVVMVDCR